MSSAAENTDDIKAGSKRECGEKDESHESESKKQCTKPKHTLYPYLFFNGNGKEVVDFYAKVFDAGVPLCKTFKEGPPGNPEIDADPDWGDKIMHASINFGDNVIMISDSKTASSTSNIHLCISCGSVEALHEAFDRLSEGGKVTMPVAEQFWGAHFGSLVDKFGINWMMNCDK